MELYKKGVVTSTGKSYIVFETQNIGEIIYTINPKQFKTDELIQVFIYRHKSDYVDNVYGFITFEERIMFENLMSVAGVGPRSAMVLLKDGVDKIVNLIKSADVDGISSYQYIGRKTASKIVFDLKDKYKDKNSIEIIKPPKEFLDSLKILGFSKGQIQIATRSFKNDVPLENAIENAIREISNAKYS